VKETICFLYVANDLHALLLQKQSLADRAKSWADQLKDVAALQLRVVELEQKLKQAHEVAATDRKKLEDELAEEKHKTHEANTQFNAMSTGKANSLVTFFVIDLYC
jgi:hypothetical protein